MAQPSPARVAARWLRDRSASSTTAYHCGGKLSRFDLAHVGKGEGLGVLGPGIYFASTPELAGIYCKYSSEPHLYEVTLNTRGYYNSQKGTPAPQRDALLALIDQLVEQGRLERTPSGFIRGVDSFKHGQGSIGAVIKALGVTAGRRALIDIGITGAYENIPSGIEYVAFDMSTIKIVSTTPQAR